MVPEGRNTLYAAAAAAGGTLQGSSHWQLCTKVTHELGGVSSSTY